LLRSLRVDFEVGRNLLGPNWNRLEWRHWEPKPPV